MTIWEQVRDIEEENKAMLDTIGELQDFRIDGWISVEDRLPKRDGRYLIYHSNHGATISIGTYYPGTGWYYNGSHSDYVRFWQPLPAPPDTEEEG